ncbi:MAG: AarF/UbiB family protein [Gammaproteobacteria bacterium]
MSARKYAAGAGRLLVIFAILARQFVTHLPHRLPAALRPRSRKRMDQYLQTRGPRVTGPESARETLERLGPTFIKFGQFLSVRPDLVPPNYCAEFRKLQDHVPPFPFHQARAVLEKELPSGEETFVSLEPDAVAAASVAQVHRGRLPSGEEVAVKIQRPGIRERMEEDILIMLLLAHVLETLVVGLRKNRLVMLVHEFSRWTARELDFCNEGQNLLLSAHYFEGYPRVRVPRVYLDLTTEQVLVMEFIRGVNALEAEPGSFDNRAVARLIADSMLKQIFVDGFFHGDPHAGNIILLPDGSIAYIDYGIVGYMTQQMRELAFEIVHAMAEADIPRIIEAMLELCEADEDTVDMRAYRRQMSEVLAELHACQAAKVPFTHMMQRFLNTSLDFGLDVPPDFVIMSKAITTLEGTCLSLDPELKVADCLRPFVEHYELQAPDLDTVIEQLKAGPFEVRRIRRLLFKHGARAMRTLERPTFRVEGREFRRAIRELEKTSLNLASGLLIAALIVFAATVSNSSAFEQWLSRMLHLPAAPILSIASLCFAAYLWIRLYLRNRPGPDGEPHHRRG